MLTTYINPNKGTTFRFCAFFAVINVWIFILRSISGLCRHQFSLSAAHSYIKVFQHSNVIPVIIVMWKSYVIRLNSVAKHYYKNHCWRIVPQMNIVVIPAWPFFTLLSQNKKNIKIYTPKPDVLALILLTADV